MNKVKAQHQQRQLKKNQRNILFFMVVGGLLLIVAAIIIGQSAWTNRSDSLLIEVSGKPSLKVDQELIDYGDVKLNTNLTFELQLTNVGDQPLKISETPYVEVKEGC